METVHAARTRVLLWECTTNCAFWLFVLALPVQALHMVEHTVQLNQHFLGIHPARGVLGAHFDVVGVHVAFNVGIFVVLLMTWLSWRQGPNGWDMSQSGARWFLALVLFQAYHALEHLMQGHQHWVQGVAHPPGLIGQVLPNVAAHFQLNLVLTILMAIVFVKLRPRRLAMPATA